MQENDTINEIENEQQSADIDDIEDNIVGEHDDDLEIVTESIESEDVVVDDDDSEEDVPVRKKGQFNKRRQLEYFQKRRKIHYMKSVISRARVITRMIAILILVMTIIGLVKSENWYLPKKIFNSYPSEHLVFEGNNITPNLKILNAVRRIKIPNKPIYLIDTGLFEKELIKIPSVKRVYIKRFGFPASLKIVIEERKPILSIAPKENVPAVAAFTKDGTAIGRDFLPLSKNIPTYRILTYEDYFGWSKKQVEYLAYLAKTAEMYSKEEVQFIDIRNPDDVRVQIKSVNIRLGQLNKTVFKRLKKISAILPQAVNLDSEIEYIDLRWKDSAYIKLKK